MDIEFVMLCVLKEAVFTMFMSVFNAHVFHQ